MSTKSIDSLLSDGAFAPNTVVGILHVLSNSLVGIHEKNGSHGNIHAESIFISGNGNLTIKSPIPDGLHRKILIGKEDCSLCEINSVAPEMWSRGKNWTPSADIYAVGALAYHMLTSNMPFSGNTISEVGNSIQNKKLIPPISYNKEIPLWLNKLIVEMLSKDPDKRPITIHEIASTINSKTKKKNRGIKKGLVNQKPATNTQIPKKANYRTTPLKTARKRRENKALYLPVCLITQIVYFCFISVIACAIYYYGSRTIVGSKIVQKLPMFLQYTWWWLLFATFAPIGALPILLLSTPENTYFQPIKKWVKGTVALSFLLTAMFGLQIMVFNNLFKGRVNVRNHQTILDVAHGVIEHSVHATLFAPFAPEKLLIEESSGAIIERNSTKIVPVLSFYFPYMILYFIFLAILCRKKSIPDRSIKLGLKVIFGIILIEALGGYAYASTTSLPHSIISRHLIHNQTIYLIHYGLKIGFLNLFGTFLIVWFIRMFNAIRDDDLYTE